MLVRLLTIAMPFALAAASACGSGAGTRSVEDRRERGIVVYNLGSEPTSLDPAHGTRLVDLRAIGQCLEGLVRLDGDGQIAPAAAESWEVSPDGRTYRFHLRECRWSNGDPVRASDFAFAWRRMLDPETRAYWADLFFVIEGAQAYYRASPQERTRVRLGIETPDERTLVVRLTRPIPYFLSRIALEAYYPVHQKTVERLGDGAFRAPDYVCNGPFRLVEHQPRRRIVFEPNPAWRDRSQVSLNRLIFVMVENEFTEWTAYRRGEIDITESVDRSALAVMRERPDFRSVPLVGTFYLSFNCRRPPFDRVEVRRAFSLALDRRLLCERILRGGEQPATGFVPPGIPGRVGQVGNLSRVGRVGDLSQERSERPEARGEKQEVRGERREARGESPEAKVQRRNSTPETGEVSDFRAEGGDLVPPGPPTPDVESRIRAAAEGLPKNLAYSYGAVETYRSLAIAIQMMWRQRLGVEVELQSFPARLLAQSKRNKDYMIANSSWVGDYLDATTFLDIFRSDSPNNVTGWTDARYDQLLDRAAATTDTAPRAALLHEAERLLLDEMPICPVHFYAIAYLQRPGLEDVERNLLGRIDFSHARWTTKK